jgi:hypothetical protein
MWIYVTPTEKMFAKGSNKLKVNLKLKLLFSNKFFFNDPGCDDNRRDPVHRQPVQAERRRHESLPRCRGRHRHA